MTVLTPDFSKGFAYANLYNCRQFYLISPEQAILYTACRDFSWRLLRLIMPRPEPLTIPGAKPQSKCMQCANSSRGQAMAEDFRVLAEGRIVSVPHGGAFP